MCRVAIRQQAQARPVGSVDLANNEALSFGQQPLSGTVKDELDLDELLGDTNDLDLDAGEYMQTVEVT